MSRKITKAELQQENKELQEMRDNYYIENYAQEVRLNFVSLLSSLEIKTEEQAKMLRRLFFITARVLGYRVSGTKIVGRREKGGVQL